MSEKINKLSTFLATVDKKVFNDTKFIDILAEVCAGYGLKCKDFRKFYKISKHYDEDKCDDIFDEAQLNDSPCDFGDLKSYVQRLKSDKKQNLSEFSVFGEKFAIHKDAKYLAMKKHYEEKGWCKLQQPASYGRIVFNCGVKDYQSEDEKTFFQNVNFSSECDGKHKIYNFGNVWVTDPDIKTYSKVVFDPKNAEPNTLNLFSTYCSFPENLKCIDIKKVLEHYNSICGYDKACYEYLLNYLAHIVQKPQERVNTAVVMYGSEGIGKNLALQLVGDIIGSQYYGESSSPEDLFGKFGKGMYRRIMFVYDEGQKKDTKDFMNRLKTLVTGLKLRVEPKGKESFEVENFCRLFFPTNDKEPFPITKGARRWFYTKGSDKYIDLPADKRAKHFEDLALFFKDKNTQYSFYMFLKNRDISQWNADVIPQSEGLRQAIEIPLVLRCFVDTILKKDIQAYKASELLETLIEYCKTNNYSYSGYNPTSLGNYLQEYVDKGCFSKTRAKSGIIYLPDKEKFTEYLKRYNFNLEITGKDEESYTIDSIDIEIAQLEKKLAEKYQKRLQIIDELFYGDPLERGIAKPKRIIPAKPAPIQDIKKVEKEKSAKAFFDLIEKDFW